MKKARAFTLIELLATHALFGVRVTHVVPQWPETLRRSRIEETIIDCASAFSYARAESHTRGSQVDVTADALGWSNGWTVTVSAKKHYTGLFPCLARLQPFAVWCGNHRNRGFRTSRLHRNGHGDHR